MIKAVVFDMDGTLLDTERYYRRCWPASLAEYGYTMSDEQALAMRSLGQPFAQQLLKKWYGEAFDYVQTRSRRREMMEELLQREGLRCKPGAAELLAELRNRKITTAVATATDPERTEKYLKAAGIYDCFDKIVCASMVKCGKPAPDIYLYAAQQLGLCPEECAAVEDSPNGVLSAWKAGYRVIMVPDQTEPDDELQKCLWAKVQNLQEIGKLLD